MIPRQKYVLIAQYMHRKYGDPPSRSVRREYDEYRPAYTQFKMNVRDGFDCGLFYYDKDGQQRRLLASQDFSLLMDTVPV